MSAVMAGDREAWIGGFAPDAVLEDPVGLPPHSGTDAIAAFWDNGIAGLESVRFEIRRVHEAPGEAVVLADIAIQAPGGAGATYDAVLHYAVDDAGAIRSLRAFWDPESVMSQLASAQPAA
jgi:ketosteroid isomerase-like protein